jgi:hypothetical protein
MERLRERAARYVAWNWRVRKRLPRLTKLAISLGFIPGVTYDSEEKDPQ